MKNVSKQGFLQWMKLLALIFLPAAFLSSCDGEKNSKGDNVSQEKKPNVVYINIDDLGYGDVGCYGATKVKTPNIDKLAQQGRLFTDAHSASAVCSPSRYALITGQYPSRKNYWAPIFLKEPSMIDSNQVTIADVMKDAGYATAVIGKWHLGFGTTTPTDWNKELRPGPLELGFDYYFGIPVVASHPPFVYVENHRVVGWDPKDTLVYGKRANTQEFPEKFALDAIGGGEAAHAIYRDRMMGTTMKDKAIDWIKKNKNNPFFLYYATPAIHHPFTPAERFVGSSEAGRYGDYIQETDWLVGEVMKTLDEEGLADNTLLIFTSDNGGMLNQGGQDALRAGHKANGAFLGFKFDAWEGGHRIPFIARWPGKIPAGSVSDELISNVDMLATMAALVKRPLKDGEGPDSYNVLPALTGEPHKMPIRDKLVISPLNKKNLSIRKGKWMYISGQGGGGFSATKVGEHALGGPAATLFTKQVNSDIENGKIKEGAAPGQLYDLESDSTEKKNVYYDHPDVVKELQELLEKTLQTPQSAPREQNSDQELK